MSLTLCTLVIRVFFFGLPKGGGSDSVKRFFFLTWDYYGSNIPGNDQLAKHFGGGPHL